MIKVVRLVPLNTGPTVILNLTQDRPSREQIDAGVTEPIADVLPLLDIGYDYDHASVKRRARQIAEIVLDFATSFPDHVTKAMIGGGPPALTSAMENELVGVGIPVCYPIFKKIQCHWRQDQGPGPGPHVEGPESTLHFGFCEVGRKK